VNKLVPAILVVAALIWLLGNPNSVEQILYGIAIGVGVVTVLAAAAVVRLTRW
jgi:hypothetical protein